ncbi:MAG: DUF1080 domain-containing protein [Verrucomicrobia bacterium]|nr:DUF1080 domain-containing protein [Verrucomicrobiota bacterium]
MRSLFVLFHLMSLAVMAAAEPGPTWTDPGKAAAEDPDFVLQGEYGSAEPGGQWGVQVVALGGGAFDAYLLEGGLPGVGWTRGRLRVKLSGNREADGTVPLVSGDGICKGTIRGGKVTVSREGKELGTWPKVERMSPTLGAKPPEGAVVLFDGSGVEEWEQGVMKNGLLENSDPHTKRTFGSYRLHVEFRTPYKPFARGQQRGNSGVYHQWRYETQVLDSFGLEGEDNETGGVYKISKSLLNMCYPPLAWQTYDFDFTTAKFDGAGQLTAKARITVRLNGVLVQDDLELPTTTGGAKLKLTPEPGPIYLQSHGNPVFYRNLWIVPR